MLELEFRVSNGIVRAKIGPEFTKELLVVGEEFVVFTVDDERFKPFERGTTEIRDDIIDFLPVITEGARAILEIQVTEYKEALELLYV
jgi:hypothetical protein